MKPAYVIWDWNGTLLDDAQTCVDTMNAMLSRRGLPLLTMARYREIFTFPVENYYRAAGFDLSPCWRRNISAPITRPPLPAACAPAQRKPWSSLKPGAWDRLWPLPPIRRPWRNR